MKVIRSKQGLTAGLVGFAAQIAAQIAAQLVAEGVETAAQLAVLRMDEDGAQPEYSFCTPFFRSLEQRHEVFANVFAYNPDTLQVRGRVGSENIQGMLVSGQFFQALETPPLLGRYLTPLDDQPGGNPAGLAVVISEDFWNNWFNRAPDVVGRTMVIANTPFTVAGVMPKSLFTIS